MLPTYAFHLARFVRVGSKSCAKLLVALTIVAPFAFALGEKPIEITNAVPLSPQPNPEAIMPGLSVNYLYQKFYTLEEIYEPDVDPTPGEPIPYLNQVTETDPATGEDKILNVLTSDQDMMVGALIRGVIHFAEKGTYVMRINSNDGVRVWVGGAKIWEDPEIHFDRLSPPLEIVIEQPGWYEFNIDYYQKKGTSALQALWTPPGGGDEVPVPPEAFGHLK